MEFLAFEPLNDLVLVRRIDETKKIHTGTAFVIPDKYQQQSNRGIVVAVNPSLYGSGILQVGDRITFGVYSTEPYVQDGEVLELIRFNDIRGVERCR